MLPYGYTDLYNGDQRCDYSLEHYETIKPYDYGAHLSNFGSTPTGAYRYYSNSYAEVPQRGTPVASITAGDEKVFRTEGYASQPRTHYMNFRPTNTCAVAFHEPSPPFGNLSISRYHPYRSKCTKGGYMAETSLTRFPNYHDRQLSDVGRTQDYYPDRLPSGVISSPPPTFSTPSDFLVGLPGQGSRDIPAISGLGRMRSDYHSSPGMPSPSDAEITIPENLKHVTYFLASPSKDPSQRTISSHEKKRYYLECLEYYVTFLHEHCNTIGLRPPPLERAQGHDGLDIKSIRSLLVQMKRIFQDLSEQIEEAERRFLLLTEALEQRALEHHRPAKHLLEM